MLKILSTNISPFLNTNPCDKTKRKSDITKKMGDLLINYGLKHFFGLKPKSYKIIKNEHGKPYLFPSQNIYYNISHSGDYVICAFSDKEVGIDIQKIGKTRIQVAERYFNPSEVEKIKSIIGDEQNKLFFHYWTIKESYLKYIGEGISGGLSSFEVRIEKDKIQIYKNQNLLPIYISYCDIDKEYLCYVTSENYSNPEITHIGKEKLIQAEVL